MPLGRPLFTDDREGSHPHPLHVALQHPERPVISVVLG
jgi:hypothetical protein